MNKIKLASAALREGLAMRASLPIVGLAERAAEGTKFKVMQLPTAAPTGNRRQRRAKKGTKQ